MLGLCPGEMVACEVKMSNGICTIGRDLGDLVYPTVICIIVGMFGCEISLPYR
jgi:hypothetical protein